jgi:uncharacterized RDD family membrane protein YckC
MTQPPEPPWEPPAYGGPEPSPAPPPYGGRWRRLIAAIIDGLIVYAVTWLAAAPFIGFGTMYEGSLARQTAANLVAGVLAFLYYALQHGRWGQTVGKRMLALRVVRADDFGRISYGQAAWRLVFAYVLSLLTCGIGGVVDVAWILWDERRQALHDKVARTVVVAAEPGMPDPYERP